jgi:hypothetical protein
MSYKTKPSPSLFVLIPQLLLAAIAIPIITVGLVLAVGSSLLFIVVLGVCTLIIGAPIFILLHG